MIVISLGGVGLWMKSACEDRDDRVAEHVENSMENFFINPSIEGIEETVRAYEQAERKIYDPPWCAILDPD